MATTPNRKYELQLTGSNRGRWGVILNNILNQIDTNISSKAEIDCSGSSNITVTDDESANIYQKLTGTLTGNIEVIYPDRGSFFFIENATTGSFTVKVVNVLGGTGVTVDQGDVALVYADADSNKIELIDNGISSSIDALRNEIKTVYVPTVGGTANAITLTPITAISAYAAGQRFRFILGSNNTSGAVTVNVSSLGVKTIKKTIGSGLVALAVGDLIAGNIADIEYNGTDFQLMSVRPQAQSSDVASASTVDLNSTTGDYAFITGTTTINTVTLTEGRRVLCRFEEAVTITDSANLICPGGVDLVTYANQIIELIGEASSVVRVRSFADSIQGAKADTAVQPALGQPVNYSYSIIKTLLSGSVVIPADNSKPQIGEGKEFITAKITPKSATNKLRITFMGSFFATASVYITAALFKDSDADALTAKHYQTVTAGNGGEIGFIYEMDAGTTSEITFSVRAGPSSAATIYANGYVSQFFGGVGNISLLVEEIQTV